MIKSSFKEGFHPLSLAWYQSNPLEFYISSYTTNNIYTASNLQTFLRRKKTGIFGINNQPTGEVFLILLFVLSSCISLVRLMRHV